MTLSLQKCRAAGFLPVLERDEGTAVGGEHQIALRKAHFWAFGLDPRARRQTAARTGRAVLARGYRAAGSDRGVRLCHRGCVVGSVTCVTRPRNRRSILRGTLFLGSTS